MPKGPSLREALVALSSLARTGWMLRGVPRELAETVAEHSFMAAVIALELASEASRRGLKVDPFKAASMALIHDMAESIIGDIPKRAGIDKSGVERSAFMSLPVSATIKSLYEEFEEGKSLEAVIARVAELTATLLKGLEYKRQGYEVDEIIESMREGIRRIASSSGLTWVIDFVGRLAGLTP